MPPEGNAAQAALDLPSAADLFPPKGKHSPAGAFAEFCLKKIRRMLCCMGTSPAADEWHKGFSARDRAYLCQLAQLRGSAIASMKWETIAAADRARLLAAFERLRHWCQVHEEFSVKAEVAEFAAEAGHKFLTPEPRTVEDVQAAMDARERAINGGRKP